MATEIEQIEDLIIAAVKAGVAEFSLVDAWPEGRDLDTLLEETLSTPACYVIWGGKKTGGKKTIGANNSDDDMTYRLTIIVENLRSMKDGSRGGYQLVEALETLLKGFKVTPLRGFLWPVSADLIAVRGQYFAYGMEFIRRTI